METRGRPSDRAYEDIVRIGTPGPALQATGVPTSCDKFGQVATSPDKSRLLGQLTLTQGPRTVRAVSAGPRNFRKLHQTTRRHSHRVPGPSWHFRRFLEPSETSVRPSETKAKRPISRKSPTVFPYGSKLKFASRCLSFDKGGSREG